MVTSVKKNPYRRVERVLEKAGTIFLWALAAATVAVWIAFLWSMIGPWALLLPVALPVAAVALGVLGALIRWPFYKMADIWRRKAREWDRDTRSK